MQQILGEHHPTPRGRRRGTALVAVSGDRHSLATAMAAAALREDNWHVHHLGADMPPDELASFCRTHDVDVAVITVTNPEVAPVAAALAERLRREGTRRSRAARVGPSPSCRNWPGAPEAGPARGGRSGRVGEAQVGLDLLDVVELRLRVLRRDGRGDDDPLAGLPVRRVTIGLASVAWSTSITRTISSKFRPTDLG